jgi:hypothetical protein
LPRFTAEDVSGTADYYNRLARHLEANMDPPAAWTRRISLRLALRKHSSMTAKKSSPVRISAHDSPSPSPLFLLP